MLDCASSNDNEKEEKEDNGEIPNYIVGSTYQLEKEEIQ